VGREERADRNLGTGKACAVSRFHLVFGEGVLREARQSQEGPINDRIGRGEGRGEVESMSWLSDNQSGRKAGRHHFWGQLDPRQGIAYEAETTKRKYETLIRDRWSLSKVSESEASAPDHLFQRGNRKTLQQKS